MIQDSVLGGEHYCVDGEVGLSADRAIQVTIEM